MSYLYRCRVCDGYARNVCYGCDENETSIHCHVCNICDGIGATNEMTAEVNHPMKKVDANLKSLFLPQTPAHLLHWFVDSMVSNSDLAKVFSP